MENDAEKIYLLIHHCHEQCHRLHSDKYSDEEFRKIGIGTRQGVILKLLLNNGSMTQKELTYRLQITSSSCGELIGKLEQAKYLKRSISKTDKRTFDVHLTESGRKMAEKYREKSNVVLNEWASDLTDDEQKELYTLLCRLSGGLEKQLNKKEFEK